MVGWDTQNRIMVIGQACEQNTYEEFPSVNLLTDTQTVNT